MSCTGAVTAAIVGITATAANQSRLVEAIAFLLPNGLLPAARLWFGAVVAGVLHLKQQHHLVIFVDGVVAVHRVAAAKVAKAHDDFDLVVEAEPDDVLAAVFHMAAANRAVVAPNDLELLQVDVKRVLPPARVVSQNPPLRGIALDREAEAGAIHQPVVRGPLAVRAIEAERPRQPDSIGRRGGGVARAARQAEGGEDAIVRAARYAGVRHRFGIEAAVRHAVRSDQPEF